MNVATAHVVPTHAKTITSRYEVQEQSDGQICFQTYPASKPMFTFDSGVIVVGFAVPILGLDYFLLGTGNLIPALVTTIMAVGVAWLCLRILHRERRHGVRPGRFYVSNTTLNIPSAPTSNANMTTLHASSIDRLVIRSTIAHEETTNSSFGTIGSRGMQARDKRTAWFAENSFILEAQSGGRGYLLANGLNETTAHGLMTRVSRKLGF
ncbi:hypothetical protein [Dyella mobilis]|uniref:Uncharacterized protein n=1 Tax=Dyella mobilis TaxID=1849582 RepID=A0ABS2KIK5_9GAMM|nr:hypothetical protein [Dyella mobilis]MBM7130995.1 hypothetical protein [Dyella mobilis]GLQ97623.1 hypothetical protein GCM10007863_20430 [Dyella mobilis]